MGREWVSVRRDVREEPGGEHGVGRRWRRGACALLIHSTYKVLLLEIGTGRDERVRHRRVPFLTGPVKRCPAILRGQSSAWEGRRENREEREEHAKLYNLIDNPNIILQYI